MISFIKTVKPSRALDRLLKPETLGVIFLSAKNDLISHSLYKQNSNTISTRKCHTSRNNPKNFGKIIELGEDFRDLMSEVNPQKRKSTKISKNYVTKTGEEVREEEEGKEELEDSNDLEENFRYLGRKSVSSKDENAILLSSIMSKLKSKKWMEKNKEIVLEGKRLIYTAIAAGFKPKKIFFSRSGDLDDLNLPHGTEVFRTPYKCFKLWGDVVTPQGVLGIFEMPNPAILNKNSDCLPLTIICDNVRDPTNMGSIIRSVAGVGCEKLILTSGCAGIWDQKVLRAGAGAHFHFPIETNFAWTDVENLISDNCKVFLADGHCQSQSKSEGNQAGSSNFIKLSEASQDLPVTSYYSVEFENNSTVIVIGGETHGLSNEAYEFARKRNGTRLFIPITDKIESLNNSMALAILAFEYKRQIHCKMQKESHLSEAINGDAGREI